MRKRISLFKKLTKNCIIGLFIFLIGMVTDSLSATGTYFIGKDERGVYFQTEHDGGWYIAEEDLRYFKVGETGTYSIERDRHGTYVRIEKNRKFYLDVEAKQQLEHEINAFNREQQQIKGKETKVIIKGNQVLVPVVLGYGGNETEALLLLDTGASIITLHRAAAEKLKISNTQKASITVVGGSTIQADVAKLDYVRVGPNMQEDLYATIIDHKGEMVAHQGLLGMNFLRGRDYKIDFTRQVISWE